MNTLRSFSMLAALSLAGAAYAQTQATPDPDTGPPSPSQSSSSTQTTPDSSPSAASSPHQREATSQSNQQESTNSANPDPSAASSPHQRNTTRMAAAGGSVAPGMQVKSPSGDALGTVAVIVPDAASDAGYVVIATSAGDATAVPYATASSMVRNDTLVMDKSRLQNAPKVQRDQMEDRSSNTWQKKADKYWTKHGSTDHGQDAASKNPDQGTGTPR
ncbi:MAG: hypothetical protein JWN85_3340 [Gammaproteobacteria bacterium]|nr:hypothetical protein [Gammaproteobacteria bacterium]